MDFLEKVTEDCATYLMLTPYRDETTGELHTIRSAEEAQAMAREFFAVKETQRQTFHAEEVAWVKQRKPGVAAQCKTCGGYGHLASECPATAVRQRGQIPSGICSTCGGKDHSARDHVPTAVTQLVLQERPGDPLLT